MKQHAAGMQTASGIMEQEAGGVKKIGVCRKLVWV
jgi:hypothetical protein